MCYQNVWCDLRLLYLLAFRRIRPLTGAPEVFLWVLLLLAFIHEDKAANPKGVFCETL